MFTYFSNIFLAVRRTVDNSERLLSFPWPAQQAFERKRKGFKLGRGKGEGNGNGTLIISPSPRAQVCARIPFPFPFEGLPLILSFFFTIYDVDVICVSVAPPYYRTRRNISK